MRYFRLVGSETYNYYENGLHTVKRGQLVKCAFPWEFAKFENNKLFTECNANGVAGHIPGSHPEERITSRTRYRYGPTGQLEKIS